MLRFACIRDCSVCPFSCNRQNKARQTNNRSINTELPKTLETQEIKPEFAENLQNSDLFQENNPVLNDNLPVLADIQYTVETIEKKKLFNRRKKK